MRAERHGRSSGAIPQLAARGRWAKVGSPAGELDLLKPPFNLRRHRAAHGRDPGARASTAGAILAELGYRAAEIDRLRRDQAI